MSDQRLSLGIRRLALPGLLALLTILLSLGHLLDPAVVPAFRDLPFFHLPLRSALVQQAARTLPTWNDAIHGGQPILSNPNYAAFYPPTWLAALIPPFRSIAWLLILHGLVAYAGAWRLLASLGATRSARALGAVAYFSGGAFLASTNTLNLYSAMALLPWLVCSGIAALDRSTAWTRSAALAGLCLGLQFLAGAPEAVVISTILLLTLAWEFPRKRWTRLAVVFGLAALLACVQLIPTLHRVADSERSQGLDSQEALAWSLPPLRVVELAYPHVFGDPTRGSEDLFFGWGIHDHDHPYMVSIYPGLLVLSLGLATLLAFPVPYRRAWTLAAGIGFLLALGRHNPIYREAIDWIPWLGAIRYPEKFVLLSTSCLAIAAALGWHHLLRSRSAPQPAEVVSRLPSAISLMLFGGASGFAALIHLRPQWVVDFMASHHGSPLSTSALAKGLSYLEGQAWISMALAASTALLLAALRRPRLPSRLLATLAIVLLTGDLLYFARGTTPVVDAAEVLQAPADYGEAQGQGLRVFAPSFLVGHDRLHLRRDEAGVVPLRSRLERLAPYVANLWDFQYVVHVDFDRMATRWARHAESAYQDISEHGDLGERFLGAWDVALLVDPRPIEDLLRDRLDGLELKVATHRFNPYRKERIRLANRVRFHEAAGPALAAARAGRFDVTNEEHLIADHGGASSQMPPGRILEANLEGGRVHSRYRSEGPSIAVLAMTFDDGWQAAVDGREARTHATALGQIAVEIPAGEHRLELRYRQRGLVVGSLLSLLAILLISLLVWKDRPTAKDRMTP